MHIHVLYSQGEAKFWLDPRISLASSYGLKTKHLNEMKRIIEERSDEIRKAWEKHFGN